MYFLLSICTETFQRMMSMRKLYRQLGVEVATPRNTPDVLSNVRRSFGGRIVLLDWNAGVVIADHGMPGVSGLAASHVVVAACSWIEQCVKIYNVQDGEVSTVTHPWFNYLHSIELTPEGTFLLTSAGSDLIVEVAASGDVVWEWFGPEHGYDRMPDGGRAFFDRQADYRRLSSTTGQQAMHVTSAVAGSNGRVLATLFHQGVLISIDRDTGSSGRLLEGLSRPHGIHRHGSGFILSDTLGHRILLLDDAGQIRSEIPFGSQWLQDAIGTSSGTYLTLENVHIDQVPEVGLRNCVTEVDARGTRLRELDVDTDYRLFTAREVDKQLALRLARLWGRSGSFGTWRSSVAGAP